MPIAIMFQFHVLHKINRFLKKPFTIYIVSTFTIVVIEPSKYWVSSEPLYNFSALTMELLIVSFMHYIAYIRVYIAKTTCQFRENNQSK